MKNAFENLFSGFKTYATSIAATILAVLAFVNGEIDLAALVTAILAAFGLASLRAGVSTETKKAVEQSPPAEE